MVEQETINAIDKLVREDVNPALAQDKGMVQVAAIEDCEGVVKVVLEFFGMCQGCPGATGRTLQSIEAFFQAQLSMPDLIVVNINSE